MILRRTHFLLCGFCVCLRARFTADMILNEMYIGSRPNPEFVSQ